MVIAEKFAVTRMDSRTVGFGGEYDIPDVPHAMRLTRSGTFVHGNYWSEPGVFGRTNVSHGCIGLLDTKGGSADTPAELVLHPLPGRRPDPGGQLPRHHGRPRQRHERLEPQLAAVDGRFGPLNPVLIEFEPLNSRQVEPNHSFVRRSSRPRVERCSLPAAPARTVVRLHDSKE